MVFVITLRASIHRFCLPVRVDIVNLLEHAKPHNLFQMNKKKISPQVQTSAVIPIIVNITAGEPLSWYPD